VDEDGSDIDVWLYVDGGIVDSDTLAATAFSPVTSIVVNGLEDTGDHMPIGLAHPVVYAPYLGNEDIRETVHWAAHGYPGEPAGERIERLCEEEGVPFTSTGTMADTEPMGPQPAVSVVGLLAECAATDMGILHEQADAVGIHYRSRASLLNQTAALSLDYSAGQIAPGLDIDLDDRATGNDITVRRADGATARASRETGHPMAVDAIGRVRRDPEANPASEQQLAGQAGWRLHLGTWDEARYPRLTVDLDAASDLVADVDALAPGDVIEVTGLDHDTVTLLIQGWTEHVETHRRKITFNCTPAGPWSVAVADDTDLARADSLYSTLAAQFAAGTAVSMSVAVEAGKLLWRTGSSSPTFPFDVHVGGVRLRVTAISGGSSPQTFTVQQAPVNGVVKTIAAGTKVSAWQPARAAL
jgi:hypothetical protein